MLYTLFGEGLKNSNLLAKVFFYGFLRSVFSWVPALGFSGGTISGSLLALFREPILKPKRGDLKAIRRAF
jgi:hypothetical protein